MMKMLQILKRGNKLLKEKNNYICIYAIENKCMLAKITIIVIV